MRFKNWALAALLLLLIAIFAGCDSESTMTYGGVRVAGIDVGNMSPEQVKAAISSLEPTQAPAKVIIDSKAVYISAEDVDAVCRYDETAESARMIGKDSNAFVNFFTKIKTAVFGENLLMHVSIDEQKLSEILETYETQVRQPEVSYGDNELVLTNGTSGFLIDRDEAAQKLCAYFGGSEDAIEILRKKSEPDKFDAQLLYDEYAGDFKDAQYVLEDGVVTVTEGSDGVEFDVDEAARIIASNLQEGATFSIPAEISVPEYTKEKLEELLFSSTLSTFSTQYKTSSANRSNNIVKASEAMNGKILMPGEEFSFNDTVGQRTTARGYTVAHAYANGQVIDEVGGGICQVSSTLYVAALYANLEITSRRNHQLPVAYVKAGLDATVDWGNIDFKFKNNTSFPVKIQTANESKKLTITMVGTKTDPEITIEVTSNTIGTTAPAVKEVLDDTLAEGVRVTETSGANGIIAEAYRIVYKNGVELNREYLGKSTYKATTEVVRVGTNKELAAQMATEGAPILIVEPTETEEMLSDSGL
ncbi:MAG: VanW family protein [Clostridia bacterium]|nr:VanW family protein [Clostridia bacterium]